MQRFSPKDFLIVAKGLNEDSQAISRTIINRSYYSAFGYVREILKDFSDATPSVHKNLILSLKNSDNVSKRKAGSKLEELFKQRKKADYDYHINIPLGSADFCIQNATKIMELLNQFLEEEKKNESLD